MYLQRKINSPILTDQYGILHPNLCVKFYSVVEDKKQKWLQIHCAYYHTSESIIPFNNVEFGLNPFSFTFNNEFIPPEYEPNSHNIIKLGYPTYSLMKQDISISDDGEIFPLTDNVNFWILNQPYYRDCQGKIFSENWEIIN